MRSKSNVYGLLLMMLKHEKNVPLSIRDSENIMDQPTKQCAVSFKDYPWSSPQDIYDYYDLRYLFDDDEILEIKRQLIEDSDKIFWHTYDDDEDEYNEGDNQPVAMNHANVEVEEENWDEDEEWEVRFEHGIGFYHDGYDSGIDEPYSKRQKFPSWYNDEDSIDNIIVYEAN